VSDQWDEMAIPDRLVAVSPIPLNEEQRKILTALDDPDCRFITVQGPPGTGKSHTMIAIAFNCILHGKNALILSDKQEALNVVEEKLKAALASVRQDDDFPDPILRLGKTGNTYTRLISQSSQEKIRSHYRATKTHAEKLSAATEATHQEIRWSITQTIRADRGESSGIHQDAAMPPGRRPSGPAGSRAGGSHQSGCRPRVLLPPQR